MSLDRNPAHLADMLRFTQELRSLGSMRWPSNLARALDLLFFL